MGHGGTELMNTENEAVLQLSLVGFHSHWGPKFRNLKCDCVWGGRGAVEERREGKSPPASSLIWAFDTHRGACQT